METSNFALLVVSQGIEQVQQKNWRGKVQYPLAAAVMTPATYAFDIAVFLGNALKEHEILLIRILNSQILNLRDSFKSRAETMLSETAEEEMTGLKLFAYPTMQQLGVNPLDLGSMQQALKQNIDDNELNELIFEAWGLGLAFVVADPDFATKYQTANYSRTDETSWNEARSHGLEIPEEQDIISLEERTGTYLSQALVWAKTSLAPELINELNSVLNDYPRDPSVIAMTIAWELEFDRYRKAAEKAPQSKQAFALMMACSRLGTQGAAEYLNANSALTEIYSDNDQEQAHRLMFVWAAFTLGWLRSGLLETYSKHGWQLVFPENENFPIETARGIAEQFKKNDEKSAREDGGFSMSEWLLLHWLTVYALKHDAVKLPAMPISSRDIVESEVAYPTPDELMFLPSVFSAIGENLEEVAEKLASEM